MRHHNGKRPAFNFGKSITSQTLLYQHMSNHYRRILNAKKAVDTAPPIAFKEKQNARSLASSSPVNNFVPKNIKSVKRNISPASSERTISTNSNGGFYWGTESEYGNKFQNSKCNCSTAMENMRNTSDMELVDKIAYDTKCGPADCFVDGCKDVKGKMSSNKFKNSYDGKINRIRNNSAGNTKKISMIKNKTTAQKRKLPHKKESKDSKEISQALDMVKSNSNHSNREAKRDGSACKCSQPLNAREASQTSSRDSAYNGGVSSLPESRSPTPDQRKVKNCCCAIKSIHSYFDSVNAGSENLIVPNLRLTENQHSQTEICPTVNVQNVEDDDRPIKDNCQEDVIRKDKFEDVKSENFSNSKNVLNDDMEKKLFMHKIKEEVVYTNFIRDITTEVLEKGLYTNKALKKVMKRHMLSNIRQLDKSRMLKEIDKLRIQLGIPEDEELLNINLDLSTESIPYEKDSVISDSELTELTFPKEKEINVKCSESGLNTEVKNKLEKSKDLTHSGNSFPKSISEILDQSDNNNQIVLNSDTDDDDDDDDDDEELISVIHVSKMLKKKCDQSHSVLQGNSADESEQSSDHAIRRKKLHPSRYRKIEKSSSSSEDMIYKNRYSDIGKYFSINIRKAKNGPRTNSNEGGSKSCSDDEPNATDAEVEFDSLL